MSARSFSSVSRRPSPVRGGLTGTLLAAGLAATVTLTASVASAGDLEIELETSVGRINWMSFVPRVT